LVLILVLVKFFLLLRLYGNFLHWTGLKLTLIGVFHVFLEVHTTMIVEFYGVIHVIDEAQKMKP